MERLAVPALSSSPDRDLLDAIRAWQTDPRGMSLLEYTGLRRSEHITLTTCVEVGPSKLCSVLCLGDGLDPLKGRGIWS